jgi:hypothetical protein
LDGQLRDIGVRAGIEAAVERAVWIKSSDVVARVQAGAAAAKGGEKSAG